MKQKYIIMTLLVLLGTSCTGDFFVSNQSGIGDVQVIASWTKSRVGFDEIDNMTYANWHQDDRVNLYTLSQGNWEYYATIEGDGYTASSATFVPSGDGLKNVDGEKVYACYHTPFADISTEIVDGVVALPNTSFIHGTHYVPLPFSYAISKIENSKVNFHFEHVFSYLKLTLELDEEYLASVSTSDGDKTLSRLLVKSSSDSLGIVSGKFNFADKKVIIDEVSDVIEMIAVSSLGIAYIPILPQEANVEMSIYGLHDTETNCDTLFSIKKQTPSTGFLAGNVYRLGIRGNIVPKLDAISLGESTSTGTSVTSSIIDAGTSPISEVGFCYSKDNQEPNKETDTFIDLTGQKDNESFSTIIEGLEAGVTYYIRAYAVNADGIGYSDVISFSPMKNSGISEGGLPSLDDIPTYEW